MGCHAHSLNIDITAAFMKKKKKERKKKAMFGVTTQCDPQLPPFAASWDKRTSLLPHRPICLQNLTLMGWVVER